MGAVPANPSRQLWAMGSVLRDASVKTPLLASWESKTHPAQIRLQEHLADLKTQLGDLDELGDDLGLEYSIDVSDPARLLHHYDLENYLTPVVNFLGARRFRHVRARKFVGGGSTVRIFSTQKRSEPMNPNWDQFCCRMSGSVQTKRWKTSLRDAIKQSGACVLPPGQVSVEILWVASPKRNWVGLWKPTGDAMGPVLGDSPNGGLFNPQDDRITELGFHLHHDSSLKHDVEVALWWKHIDE